MSELLIVLAIFAGVVLLSSIIFMLPSKRYTCAELIAADWKFEGNIHGDAINHLNARSQWSKGKRWRYGSELYYGIVDDMRV